MWNYTYMIPSFLVLLIFLVYYLVLPKVAFRMNRTFIWVLMLETVVMFFDMASSYADEYYQDFSVPVLYALNLCFFVFYLARAFAFYTFTLDVLGLQYSNSKGNILLTFTVFLVSQAITLSSLWTGAVFRIGNEGYERGPLYHILYVLFILCILSSVWMLLMNRKRVRIFDFYSVLGYNLILLIGNIVRLLLPSHLIMNTFCLMGIIIIYLTFVNPDLYLSQRTGAFNRRAMVNMLGELIRKKKSFGILAFGIRNYFEGRDVYGGAQMDQGTAMIGRYLTQQLPELTVFYVRNGRYALIGDKHTDWKNVRDMIASQFLHPWKAADAELYLSVGFVQVSPSANINSVEKLMTMLRTSLNKVDQGDYTDDILIDQNSSKELEQQLNIKRSLEYSLDHNEVEIFLQPLVDSKTRKMVGAEALARIRDAEGNIIPPGQFIPMAETNGRINLLGEQVLEKTCEFIQQYPLSLTGMSWINVNLSPIQCMRRDLNERYKAILEKYGVAPEQIRLEVTEASMVDRALLEQQIRTLKANGFQFVLDDYGSGYSNINRIRRYPFINIKLDMEMVWSHFNQPDQMLPTIVQTFKQMRYDIVAEGVETAEMADALRDMGCDYLQGYYFSKPLPVDAFVEKYAK